MSEFAGGDRKPIKMPEPMPFPEKGLPENDVLMLLMEKLAKNIPAERNFANSYSGPAHPFALKAYQLAWNSVLVSGWGEPIYDGTYEMHKEAVRMVSSLLGLDEPKSVGFITSGGTESNLIAMRVAKLLSGKRKPEVIMPTTAHFSFNLAGDLFGIRIRRVGLNADFTPRMDQVKNLINENTIALVCSAPESSMGVMDPVKEFAEIAERRGIYLHIDAAFGGFLFPFMRELGYRIPAYDFGLPSVSSMMADGHKLGLLPLSCGFIVFRDRAFAEAIPTERILIHTITSTKSGGNATAAWALFQHLGREGYRNHVKNALEVTNEIAERVEAIPGLRLIAKPLITIVGYTAERGISLEKVYEGLIKRRWGASLEVTHGPTQKQFIRHSIHPYRTRDYAEALLGDLEDSVKEAKSRG